MGISGTRQKLKGTGVAIVTPFHKDGSIDFKSLGKIVDHIIKGGVEYIVVLGTTGESVTLSKDEKKAVVSFVVEHTENRVPVVLGVGGNYTQEVVASLKSFDMEGITAILSVSPYYNKPNQTGIYQHYKALSEATPLPIILYNVPGRTGSNMLPDTTISLANDFENIIAIKEASGNIEQIMKIIKNKPKDFMVISGDDSITLPVIACGGEGVISVVANAFPKYFSEMVRQALAGNFKKAQELQYKHTDIIEQLFADGNPGGIKIALEILKLSQSYVRQPLAKPNKKVIARLEELIKEY